MTAMIIGLTGGVASGKSEVARRFEQRGIVVADADQAARAIVAPGEPALAEIVARFGPEFLQSDDTLDRKRLRETIFADPAARAALEAITHPRIRARLQAQCVAAEGPYAIAVIPLLAEAGGVTAYDWVQRVLVVDAPAELQRIRLMARDGICAELAEQMISAQATRQQRLALAQDVIVNDASSDALEKPVCRLDTLYRKLAVECRP